MNKDHGDLHELWGKEKLSELKNDQKKISKPVKDNKGSYKCTQIVIVPLLFAKRLFIPS